MTVVWTVAGVLAATGCGRVVFVDPEADEKASLQIIEARRFVVQGDPRDYFFARIGSRRDVRARIRLSAGDGASSFALPLEDADVVPCGGTETCVSLTLGPGLPSLLTRLTLEAPTLGHRTEGRLETVALGGYGLVATPRAENAALLLQLEDPIRAHFSEPEPVTVTDSDGEVREVTTQLLFPRAFEALVTPGACAGDEPTSSASWQAMLDDPGQVDATFGDAPFGAGTRREACVLLRPNRPRGGPAVISASTEARAEVTRFSHVYTPDVELAPMVFLPFYDLEIGNETRCREAEALVSTTLRSVAEELAAGEAGGAEVLGLEGVELANAGGGRCRQGNVRRFDAAAVAASIEAAIVRAFGRDRRVRVLLVYAANLDVEPPIELAASFDALRGRLSSGEPARRDFLLTIAPERAAQRLSADRGLPWLAAEDDALRSSLGNTLRTLWPFRTVVHTDQTRVPLVSVEEREAFAAFRICSATDTVFPEGEPMGPTTFLPGPSGPAYTAQIPPSILVPASAATVPSIAVEWEGCRGLCDHPAPDGDPRIPWSLTEACP